MNNRHEIDSYEYQIGDAILKARKLNRDTLFLFVRLYKIYKNMRKDRKRHKQIKIKNKEFNKACNLSHRFENLLKEKNNLPSTMIISDKLSLYYASLFFNLKESLAPSYPIKKEVKRVLLVLNTSIPYLNNGYSIRSGEIAKSLKAMGYEIFVVTRPGFPHDFFDGLNVEEKEIHDGIVYYRLKPNLFLRQTRLTDYVNAFSQAIKDIIIKENVDLVHAASNYCIGLSAYVAALSLKLPFVYEVRGFWEMTTSSKDPEYELSEEYRLQQDLETFLVRNSTKVVTISKQLKENLILRGINESKMTVVTNGVPSFFIENRENLKSIRWFKNPNQFVIGYIGSITIYEGLEKIVLLIKELEKSGIDDVYFVFAGSGPHLDAFLEYIKKEKLQKKVKHIGNLNFDEVPFVYPIFDLCIFPRLPHQVTEIVTPIKPLEAMACKKAVIVSDLAALKEFVVDGETGLVFNHELEDLKYVFQKLYSDEALRLKIGENAHRYICEEKLYPKLCLSYHRVYEKE